jgi:hypothetical protein
MLISAAKLCSLTEVHRLQAMLCPQGELAVQFSPQRAG